MPLKTYTTEEIASYLFAELPEAECDALEDAVFENDDLFALVSQVENDWIDNYVRGSLSARDRERFEQNYLTHPARLRRVQNARTMLAKFSQLATTRAVNRRNAIKEAWWRRLLPDLRARRLWALSAAPAILLLTVSIWLWNEMRQLRNQVAALQAAQLPAEQRLRDAVRQTPAPAQTPVQAPAQTPAQVGPTATVATLFLTADVLRSAEPTATPPRLTITPTVQQARLVLKTSVANYRVYRAELQDASGRKVLALPNPNHQKSRAVSTFTVAVPVAGLSTGSYVLVVNGVTDNGETDRVGNAQFRVEKK